LADCGWFPTYTITEDYALGIELKKRNYRAVYMNEYLAVGEAPEEIRNIFRQRSRWCKGQMQVRRARWLPAPGALRPACRALLPPAGPAR
jgi:endoglucanase